MMVGDVNLDDLVKKMSARLFHHNDTIVLFVLSNLHMGDTLRLCK